MFFRISGNMELDSPRLHVLPLKLATKMLSDSALHTASLVPLTAAPSPRCWRQSCQGPAHTYLPGVRWGPVHQGLAGATASATTQGQDHVRVTGARDRAPDSPAHRAHVGRLTAGTASQGLGVGEHSEHQAAPPHCQDPRIGAARQALALISHHTSHLALASQKPLLFIPFWRHFTFRDLMPVTPPSS